MKSQTPISVAIPFAVLLMLAGLSACSTGPALPEACSQLPESGRCRASIMRWWYDEKAHTCRAFVWGGCDGSVPFETQEACHAQCMPGQPIPAENSPQTMTRPMTQPVTPPLSPAPPSSTESAP